MSDETKLLALSLLAFALVYLIADFVIFNLRMSAAQRKAKRHD